MLTYDARSAPMLQARTADGPSLHVSGLSKSYAGRPALEGVTFSIRSGEVLGLIGPNGAGKTTLFECVEQHERVQGLRRQHALTARSGE